MLYEMSNNNLEQFMSTRPSPHLSTRTLLYQLSQIAGAVRYLRGHFSMNWTSEDATELFLGLDITPEHIIVFPGQGAILRLSVKPSMIPVGSQLSWKSWYRPRTRVYRQPETFGSEGTERADIWSLGCTYLEILLWHLGGYEPLKSFREQRCQEVEPGGHEDEGFYFFAETGPDAKAQLRKPVVDMLQDLRNRTQGALHAAVKVVEAMLQIDPLARPSAAKVEEDLSELVQSASTVEG